MEITCQTDIILGVLDLPQPRQLKAPEHLLWEQELHQMDQGRKIKIMLKEPLLQMDRLQHHHKHRMVRTLLNKQRIEIVISLPLRQLRVLLRTLIQMQIER